MECPNTSTISIMGIKFDNPMFDVDYTKKFTKVIDKGSRGESFIIPLYEYHKEPDGAIVRWCYDLRVGKMGGCDLDGKRIGDKNEIELCKSIVKVLGLKYS